MCARLKLTSAHGSLYYFYSMADNPRDQSRRLPPVPKDPPAKMEAWYLSCLIRWTEWKKRPPSVAELADWCKRSRTAVFSALVSLEHKGYLRRNAARKFVVLGGK